MDTYKRYSVESSTGGEEIKELLTLNIGNECGFDIEKSPARFK